MFVMYEKEKMKVPVRVWLKEREDLEGSCLEQASLDNMFALSLLLGESVNDILVAECGDERTAG